jgi:hypothetical protein
MATLGRKLALSAAWARSDLPMDKIVHGELSDETKTFSARLCTIHRHHRAVLGELASSPEVIQIDQISGTE